MVWLCTLPCQLGYKAFTRRPRFLSNTCCRPPLEIKPCTRKAINVFCRLEPTGEKPSTKIRALPLQQRKGAMTSLGASGSGGARGSGGGGGKALSRDENFDKHNLNSSAREDLTKEEKRAEKTNRLRLVGVPKQELKVDYNVPKAKQGQLPEIQVFVDESSETISSWACRRVDYMYLKLFGGGTKQALGDMKAIDSLIETFFKPKVLQLRDKVIEMEGSPLLPPDFFAHSLEDYQFIPAPKGKAVKPKK